MVLTIGANHFGFGQPLTCRYGSDQPTAEFQHTAYFHERFDPYVVIEVFEHFAHHDGIKMVAGERNVLAVAHLCSVPQPEPDAKVVDPPLAWVQSPDFDALAGSERLERSGSDTNIKRVLAGRQTADEEFQPRVGTAERLDSFILKMIP